MDPVSTDLLPEKAQRSWDIPGAAHREMLSAISNVVRDKGSTGETHAAAKYCGASLCTHNSLARTNHVSCSPCHFTTCPEREEWAVCGSHKPKTNLQIKYKEDDRIQTIQINNITTQYYSQYCFAKTQSTTQDMSTSNRSSEFGLPLLPRAL